MQRKIRRIGIDVAGFTLILLGLAFGWVPGPGGIPLILAGLGLLSINNDWAKALRSRLLEKGGSLVKIIFPDNPLVQLVYDLAAILLLVVVAILAWRHAAVWQISLAIFLFFVAVFIISLNRNRGLRLKRK